LGFQTSKPERGGGEEKNYHHKYFGIFLLLGYIYPFRSHTKDFTLHLILLEEEVLIELELIDIYLNNLFLSFQHNIHTSI